MTDGAYDLAVAYRVYPSVSKHPDGPPIFADDKLALAELCWRSFVKSLGKLRAKVWVLLDACPPEYDAMILRYTGASDVEIVRLDRAGNYATFQKQIDILTCQTVSPAVFLVEDDYFWLPDRVASMLDLLRNRHAGVDFVSPYDHLDYYMPIHLHKHRYGLLSAGGLHWREAVYSCLTFMTTRETLAQTKPVFESFSHDFSDLSIWMALTKFNVRNPYRLAKYLVRDREFLFPVLWSAYRCAWRQVLFGRRRKLVCPIPSIATHLESKYMAPNVDWGAMIAREAGEMDSAYRVTQTQDARAGAS